MCDVYIGKQYKFYYFADNKNTNFYKQLPVSRIGVMEK